MLKKWYQQIEEKVGGDEKQKKRLRLFLLMGFVGLLILLCSSYFELDSKPQEVGEVSFSGFKTHEPSTKSDPKTGTHTNIEDYEEKYETEMAEVLSQIVGVDDVSIVVNLESTAEDVIHMDRRNSEQVTTETDTKGGSRSIRNETDDEKPAFYQDGQGEKPLIVKKLKPKVRGILIVARGVEDLNVRAAVIEAVQRTLDVPVHRISVLPKGEGGKK